MTVIFIGASEMAIYGRFFVKRVIILIYIENFQSYIYEGHLVYFRGYLHMLLVVAQHKTTNLKVL